MDARNAVQRIVAIAIMLGARAAFCPVLAGSVYIYGGDFNLPIIDEPGPGVAITEAVIEVPDHFIISDLDVRINITHTNVFDLQLVLQSPLGTRLCLNMYDFKNEFAQYKNYTDTIFDDEAQIPIEQAQPPFTGRFRPKTPNMLAVFDGQDSYGSWRLQICDLYDSDIGTLDSFELMITTPEPTTAILLILGTGLMTLFTSRRARKRK